MRYPDDFLLNSDAAVELFEKSGSGERHVVFDEATDSAVIKADMGDTDPAIALAVLIRSLEGFQSGGGTPIDAVVFGTRR